MFCSFGSCGGLLDTQVGAITVPKSCVAVTRNVDYNFLDPSESDGPAYRISKSVREKLWLVAIFHTPYSQVSADPELELKVTIFCCLLRRAHDYFLCQLQASLRALAPSGAPILTGKVNASADRSVYLSG
jgi:hypothetical protein